MYCELMLNRQNEIKEEIAKASNSWNDALNNACHLLGSSGGGGGLLSLLFPGLTLLLVL